MKRTSPFLRLVSRPTRSPGRSSTGPELVRRLTPISFASRIASVVLPRPGGPKNSAWSSGSLRERAASIAIWRFSRTLAWPTNSVRREGRSDASALVSSPSGSGVVISLRALTSACRQEGERQLHELRGAPGPVAGERAAHGVVGLGGGVAEFHEGLHRRVRRAARRRAALALAIVGLVLELQHHALGGLLADAAHRGQRGEVVLADRAHDALGRELRQHRE